MAKAVNKNQGATPNGGAPARATGKKVILDDQKTSEQLARDAKADGDKASKSSGRANDVDAKKRELATKGLPKKPAPYATGRGAVQGEAVPIPAGAKVDEDDFAANVDTAFKGDDRTAQVVNPSTGERKEGAGENF